MYLFSHCCFGYVFLTILLHGTQTSCEENVTVNDTKKHGYTCGETFTGTTGFIANNTLHPDSVCQYHISVNSSVNLILRKLLLDENDNVTISKGNESEPLFRVFHGQNEAVPLSTGHSSLTITIQTSSVSNITRHFEGFYDISKECSFVINEVAVQQPLFTKGLKTECTLIYNVPQSNIALWLSFLTFNLSQGSKIEATRGKEIEPAYTGTVRPPDLLAVQAKFDIKITSEDDYFVLQQHQLNAACSKEILVTDSANIVSPPMPKLDNQSLILECRWLIKNPDRALGIRFDSVSLSSPYDVLVITDAVNFDAAPLYQIVTSTAQHALDEVLITNGKVMIVSFKPSSLTSNFSANVYVSDQGRYLQDNGTVEMKSSTKNSTWLLQVKDNQKVVLTFKNVLFHSPAVLDIYDDFNFKSNHIASLNGSTSDHVVSPTSRMMLVASNFGDGSFSAEFSGTEDVDADRKKEKGGYTCGAIFDKHPIGSIENNTLHPDTNCSYIISSNNGTINLMLKKLQLDEKDNVTILYNHGNESEPLFPVFHGQNEAVPLITGAYNVTILIEVSSTSNITRHFVAFFDFGSKVCSFVVEDDIIMVQQLLIANSTKGDCSLVYNEKNNPNVLHSFSFLTFNLSRGSSIAADGLANPVASLTGAIRPPDLFQGQTRVTFDMKIVSSEDHFVLRQYAHQAACSGYESITGSKKIFSPPVPKLVNESLILECRYFFENPKGALALKLDSINLSDPYDVLVITDAANFDSPPLYQITASTAKEALSDNIITSGKDMIVSFKPLSQTSMFSGEVSVSEHGQFMRDNGTVIMKPSRNNNTWLLQVNDTQNVILNFKVSSFKSPAVVEIYDGFSTNSKHIASLHGNVWYPIISTTSKMMIITSGFEKGSFTADFEGSATGCMHMSPGSSDSYVLSGHCNSSCAWIIPPIDSANTELLLDLQYVALENDDVVEILRLDSKASVITKITPNVTQFPKLSLKTDEGALVNVTRGACPKKPNEVILVAQANYMPTCSGNITLTPSVTIPLTSPSFPDTYPVLANCNWNLMMSSPQQVIHLAFDKLSLAPNHCLTITGNKSKLVEVSGNTMPNDFMFKANVLVQFNSKNCSSNVSSSLTSSQGFLLNVTSADCGDIVTAASGNLTTTANRSLCIWKLSVPAPAAKDSVNSIMYTIKAKNETENYELDIYDGASVREAKITNKTSGVELWSRTDTLIIVYKPIDVSKPASEVTITYKAKTCDKNMQCDKPKICMHPDWRCNGINDCGDYSDEKDCVYTPVTTASPKPPHEEGGISRVTFGIVIVLMFFLGVLVMFAVPKLRMLSKGQYRQFRDVSVIE